MIHAYGATVIEVVRRKEFSEFSSHDLLVALVLMRSAARFFYQRAQTILEVMAKLS